MTFSMRSNFTLFRPTTARELGPAVTMATAEQLDHAEKPRACVEERVACTGHTWGCAREPPQAVSAQVNHDGRPLGWARRCVRAIALDPRKQPPTTMLNVEIFEDSNL